MKWLGCSSKQAKRLWQGTADEICPVKVENQTRYMHQADLGNILSAELQQSKITLLTAHDPYLDLKDRTTILEDKILHPLVWKTVANPNVVLKDGAIVGIWTGKVQNGALAIKLLPFEKMRASEQKTIENLIQEYADFRELQIQSIEIQA